MGQRLGFLGIAFTLTVACGQIIGLGDYDKVGASAAGGGKAGSGGSTNTTGGAKSGSGGSTAGRGGTTGSGGATSGAAGEAGAGGAAAGAAGTPAEGGAGGMSGGTTGGGSGGTSGGVGTGGATVSGGTNSGGTAGASGGVAGKGGSGGASGGTCTTEDFLHVTAADNGNFDAATVVAPWYEDSTDTAAIIVQNATQLATFGVAPQTTPNAAVLGGVGSHMFSDGTLGEAYTIGKDLVFPANVTQLVLSCYVQVQSQEDPTDPNVYDFMDAWLWDYSSTGTTPFYDFHEWTNHDITATGSWGAINTYTATGADAASVSGKSLSMEFYSAVDDSFATYFFIDTCSLKVTHCN